MPDKRQPCIPGYAHHWLVPSAQPGVVEPSRCKHCSQERVFNTTPEPWNRRTGNNNVFNKRAEDLTGEPRG